MMLIDQKKLRQAVAHLYAIHQAGRLDEALAAVARAKQEHRAARADLSLRDRLTADRLAKALAEAFGLPLDHASELVVSYLVRDDERGVVADTLRGEFEALAVRTLEEVST